MLIFRKWRPPPPFQGTAVRPSARGIGAPLHRPVARLQASGRFSRSSACDPLTSTRGPAASPPYLSATPPDMPPLALPFPAFDPVLVRSDRSRSAGMRSPISSASWAAGSMRARIIRAERLWGGKPPLTVTDFDDFILWVTLGIILGGRLGYVLFYNPAYFVAHPSEIVQLWKGGMSFHGGFLGCVIAVIGVRALARHSDPVARRHRLRGRADRIVPRPHRQFHQCRIVGPHHRRGLGLRVPGRRPAAAPSEPALRGGARRASCCLSCSLL